MELSSTELNLKLSIRSVGRVFNIDHSAAKQVLLCGHEDPPGRRIPRTFTRSRGRPGGVGRHEDL
jgi:hypothetical protein